MASVKHVFPVFVRAAGCLPPDMLWSNSLPTVTPTYTFLYTSFVLLLVGVLLLCIYMSVIYTHCELLFLCLKFF